MSSVIDEFEEIHRDLYLGEEKGSNTPQVRVASPVGADIDFTSSLPLVVLCLSSASPPSPVAVIFSKGLAHQADGEWRHRDEGGVTLGLDSRVHH